MAPSPAGWELASELLEQARTLLRGEDLGTAPSQAPARKARASPKGLDAAWRATFGSSDDPAVQARILALSKAMLEAGRRERQSQTEQDRKERTARRRPHVRDLKGPKR